MKIFKTVFYILLFLCVDVSIAQQDKSKDYVVLIHGLSRTSRSFSKMESSLEEKGYEVINIDYPSRKYDIRTLSENFIGKEIEKHCTDKTKKINFVTHSLGGIIIRYYLKHHKLENIGRVVMLSPPNQGSEIVDFLKGNFIVEKTNGPAFDQLSTDPTSFVNTLGDPDFEVGIITGATSINWVNSTIIPGDDDGKVSVERSKLKNMKDFLVVQRSHPLIMNADEVIEAVVNFLDRGKFNGDRYPGD
jgi:triacylglycerol lipase